MKKLLALICLILMACASSKRMLDSSKYQPKEEVGIQNNELKTNGFYYSKQQAGSKRYISPIVLYENGPVLLFDNFGNSSSPLVKTKNGKECSLETGQDHETIIEFFECYLEMVDFKTIHSVFFVKDSLIEIESRGSNYLVTQYGSILNDSTFVINKIVNATSKKVYHEKKVYQFKKAQQPDLAKLKLYSGLRKNYLKKM